MAPAPLLCSASVSYKKRQGTLVLTPKALSWSSTGQPPWDLDLVTPSFRSLFSSKEGGPRVQLRLGVVSAVAQPEDAKEPELDLHSFTFTAASSAISDREHFKRELSLITARNKEGPTVPLSEQTAKGGGKGKERAIDSPLPPPGAGANGARVLSSEEQLRINILQKDVKLRELHRELVVNKKLLSEPEFWEGREDVLEAARAEETMRKGRSGEMVDPKPETSEGGEVTVKITPALIRDIFEEYPAVLRAYNDNVPKPLDSQTFWTRYFQSKLFNRNRTTNRAAVNTIKDDPIFDKYLGEEDDDLEPKNLGQHEIYALLDLASTEEDQHEVQNQGDYTMRAGGQRASLPLMRRFNEHSERLLNQSLGAEAKREAMALNPGDAGARNESYYSSILLDDLTTAASEDRILLNLQNRSSLVQSSGGDSGLNGEDEAFGEEEARAAVEGVKRSVRDWDADINEMALDSTALHEALVDMRLAISQKAARFSTSSGSSSSQIPDRLLKELQTLQASANEFLRHFWSAVLPAKAGDPVVAPREKAAKAERMREYLGKTEERVAALLAGLKGGQLERDKVEAALLPVREAVANAVKFYTARTTIKVP